MISNQEKNIEAVRGSFSFTPSSHNIALRPLSNRELFVQHNLDFILNHFQNPLYPRRIMTKKLGYQKEVLDKQSILKYFRLSNYEDCRINAYPSFTTYHGINRTPPSFIIIDLDLKDFGYSKDKLDWVLNKALKRIKDILDGYPTVLWTGNGYHIYQPLEGFVLEEIDIFAEFVASNGGLRHLRSSQDMLATFSLSTFI